MMNIGPAIIREDNRGFEVKIDGHWFFNGEKYTIIEQGWAFYGAENSVSDEFLRTWGETKPADDDWSELTSTNSGIVTSHPVLVALVILWHHHALDEKLIPSAPEIPIPDWDDAVEIVRNRKILNDFNRSYAGTMPGLRRWSPDGKRL